MAHRGALAGGWHGPQLGVSRTGSLAGRGKIRQVAGCSAGPKPQAAQASDKIGRLERGAGTQGRQPSPIHLVSQRNRWLAARQATIAGNVANAGTPGYAAQWPPPIPRISPAAATTRRRRRS